VLIQIDADRVVARAGVIRPERGLLKSNTIQRLGRQAGPAECKFFRVAETSVQDIDDTGAAADIPGRSDMAGRTGASNDNSITSAKTRVRRLGI
jgi:hypothetical protein